MHFKRFISAMLSGVIAATSLFSTVTAEKQLLGYLGDVNFDSTISVADAVLLQKSLVTGLDGLSTDPNMQNADVNEDGRIDVFDAVLLRRCVLGECEWKGIYSETEDPTEPPTEPETEPTTEAPTEPVTTSTTTAIPVTTTTTTTSTTAALPDEDGRIVVTLNKELDSSDDTKNLVQVALSDLIPTGAKANTIIVEVDSTADIVYGGGISVTNNEDNWLDLEGTAVSGIYKFDVSAIQNDIQYDGGIFQFGYWWGNEPITVLSITCYYTTGSSSTTPIVTTAIPVTTTTTTTTTVTEAPETTTTTTALQMTLDDMPAEYQSAADCIWQNRVSAENSMGSSSYRWNNIFDQIIDGKGTLNYVVRWHSTKTITLQQRQKLEAALDDCINQWTDWLVGYEDWPYQHVDVKIVGWAVTDSSLLLDLQPDEVVYTDTTEYVIQPGESSEIPTVMANAPTELSRFDHFWDESYEYPGGLDKRFDQYLWATQGFPEYGGCGGDWGQRLGDTYYIGMAEGTHSKHVQIHEVGHGFGFTDFYGGEGASDGFPPGGFPGGGTSIMMAGSSSEITDFDGWFMRYTWSKIKDETNQNGVRRFNW